MKKDRPKLHLPRTSFLTIIDTTAGIILLFTLVLASMYWQSMPDHVPTHFDFFGQPNGWGGKSSFLWFPMAGLIFFVVLMLLSFFPDSCSMQWKNTKKPTERQYHMKRLLMSALNLEVMVIFLYFEWMTIRVCLGKAVWTPGIFMPAMLWMIACTKVVYFVMRRRARQ